MEKLLKVLGEKVRLRIVNLLRHADELCVCDIQECLQIPQYAASRHLKSLKDLGVVKSRRDGKWVYYRLDTSDPEIGALVKNVCDLASDPVMNEDLKHLEVVEQLPLGRRCALEGREEIQGEFHLPGG